MEESNPILNEINKISTLVAAIGRRQTYTVPEGYFNSFPVQIMLRIALEEKNGSDPVLNAGKNNVYQVPAGYFDTLALDIVNHVKASEADQQLAEPDFSSPLWQEVNKKNPFTVPEGYFNEVSENIVAGAKAIAFVNEELENLSPLMAGLKIKQVYAVPEGYFENSAAAILQRIQRQPGKIISIGFSKKIIRYAAAAAIAGIVLVTGYVMSKKTDPVLVDTAAVTLDSSRVAGISDQAMEEFLNTNTFSIADTSIVPSADASGEDLTEKESRDLLANISDEELQQYLEQYGSTSNAITN
jgi:hypothetical protein